MDNLITDLMDGLKSDEKQAVWGNSLVFFEQFGFHITNYGMMDKAEGNMLGFHSNMADDWMAYYMTS